MIRGWFTIAYQPEKQPKWDEIRSDLMNRQKPAAQAAALEQLVLLSYSETIPTHLLMPVVQYTSTSRNHRVIKLLLLFLENCDTRDAMGQLRPEFILITDAIRNLMLHPNEYVRGAALRFLYKMNDTEVISQLITPILNNLTFRDEYVRRHAAILCGRLCRDFDVYSQDLADSIIEAFSTEADQRTMTAMVYASFISSPHDAANLTINMNQFYSTDVKMALLGIAPMVYKKYPQFRVRFLETVIEFCEDENVAVRLQAASNLIKLSNNPAAVRTTATAYCELLHTMTDENQKAYVVQALIDMIEEYKTQMAPLTLEMAQGTNITGSLRTKLLNKLVRLVTEDNASALISLIADKKKDSIEALQVLLFRFPFVASAIIEQIGNYVNDTDDIISEATSILVKDCGIAGARKEAFKLFSSTLEVSGNVSVLTRALWSVSEFTDHPDVTAEVLTDYSTDREKIVSSAQTVVNEDGTYSIKQATGTDKNLRSLIQEGNSLLAIALISSLIKLKIKGAQIDDLPKVVNDLFGMKNVEKNARDICNLWMSAAENPNLKSIFEKSTKNAFLNQQKIIKKESKKEKGPSFVSVSEPMQFAVLLNTIETVPVIEEEKVSLPIIQLTGPSDALYVEANCTLRKYDRIYHFTMYNRTNSSTLTNIIYEFTSIGSVSILQKNEVSSLGPNASGTFDLPVMISSGACGTLFGAVSFDYAGASGSDHQLLPLSPIEIDPFFCFNPSNISQLAFREKWAESVWERRIDIKTKETDLISYLDNVANKFKFAIITPRSQIEVTTKSAGFLAANLFTSSLFGEEVEMNISAKLDSEGSITGFLRIRSPNEQLAYLFGKLIQ